MTPLPARAEQPITLAQLSDSHLSQDPQAHYRGQPADANLARLRGAIKDFSPDAIVLSGDVSEDASPASYWRMGGFVRDLADRVAWIPGNHDDRSVMEAVFDELGFDAGPILVLGGWQIVLLDSARPDRPEGALDDERLAPLGAMDDERPALVFVHHQPLPVGSPWIDKYPLVEPERLWDRLAGKPVEVVAFGHVHQVFEGVREGVACLSAPSTAANGVPEAPRFAPSEQGPSVRWFKLWPDGRWETGLLNPAPA